MILLILSIILHNLTNCQAYNIHHIKEAMSRSSKKMSNEPHNSQDTSAFESKMKDIMEQVFTEDEIKEPGNTLNEEEIYRQAQLQEENLEESSNSMLYPYLSSEGSDMHPYSFEDLESSDDPEVDDDSEDLKLMDAIDSIEELMDSEIFDEPLSSQPQSYSEGLRRTRSVQDHDDRDLNLQLMKSLLFLDASLEISRSRDDHERKVRSVSDQNEVSDRDLDSAITSFASLMFTASSMTYQSAGDKEKYILKQVRDSYNDLNDASIKVLDNSYEAFKLVEASKTKLETLVKAVKSKEIHDIVHKISSAGKAKSKRSVSDDGEFRRRMIPRGFNKQEYSWLSREFDLSRQEADKVYMLSEEEFLKFSRSLQKADVSSKDNGYSADDLIEVFKTARQIVPAELEAAALGFVEVGKHIGGRARYELIIEIDKFNYERANPFKIVTGK